MPLKGLWHGEFRIDSQDVMQGAVVITVGDSTLNGWIVSSGVFSSQNWCRVVAGKGGLWSKQLKAQGYRDVSLKTVLESITRDSGEVLSPSVTNDTLNKRISFWNRFGGQVGNDVFNLLSAELGLSWKAMDDGKIWIGPQVWTQAPEPKDLETEELSAQRQWKTARVGSTELFPRPGTIWRDRNVDHLIFHLQGTSLRSEVFYGN